MPLHLTTRTARRLAIVRHHARALLPTPYGQSCEQYSHQTPLVHKNFRPNEIKRNVLLFPSADPLSFLAVEIICPLPKTEARNMRTYVVMDRYCRLIKAILTTKADAKKTANIVMKHGVPNFGVSSTILTENWPLFTFKFFAALCKVLGVKVLATTK